MKINGSSASSAEQNKNQVSNKIQVSLGILFGFCFLLCVLSILFEGATISNLFVPALIGWFVCQIPVLFTNFSNVLQ